MEFITAATAFTVDFEVSIYTEYSIYSGIGVFVNGVYITHWHPTLDDITLSYGVSGLAAGSKTVSLVNGLQAKPTTTRLGTWIRAVHLPVTATLSSTAEPVNRLIVYGDSITVGGDCVNLMANAWTLLVRTAYTAGQLAVEAWGYRSLYDDAVDATARAGFVSKLGSVYPGADIIWLAIGTNDYGLNKWSAANFGYAYAALLDALHVRFPTATIYTQTPIQRTVETANTFGDTLPNYRTQITTAQAARAAWCTLVVGTGATWPQAPGDLDDGVHPTDAGHLKYANSVKTVLGL